MKHEDTYILSCYTDDMGRMEAVLGFKREQLLYDIENYAHIEGHIMQTENLHQLHTVMDVADDGNIDRINRVLELTMAQCKEMLYPFTKNEVSTPELDDTLKEQQVYGMVLRLPQGFSQTTLNLLAKLIHEYVVCYALADWMGIVYPEKAEAWGAKAASMEEQIRQALYCRTGRIHRKISVF